MSTPQPLASPLSGLEPPQWEDTEALAMKIAKFNERAGPMVQYMEALLTRSKRLMSHSEEITNQATIQFLDAKIAFNKLTESPETYQNLHLESVREVVTKAMASSRRAREILTTGVNKHLELMAMITYVKEGDPPPTPPKAFSALRCDTQADLVDAFKACGVDLPRVLQQARPRAAA